jgi:hypothetical protein
MEEIELEEILGEISVGYNNNDPKSIKLNEYTNKIRKVLMESEDIITNGKLYFSELKFDSDSIDNNTNTFLQGSYATSTGIKHPSYEVDADIGFIIESEYNNTLRQKIYRNLILKLPTYNIELKKPCITIDFKDGYKIDIAIYNRENNIIYFHNSIKGFEEKQIANPKGLVKYIKDELSEMPLKRDIIRLLKHFIKVMSDELRIDENNKIPSISTTFLVIENSKIDSIGDSLYDGVNEMFQYMKNYVKINGSNGPEKKEYFTGNTFYKVTDVNQLIEVIDRASIYLNKKQFSALVENRVYNSIVDKRKMHKPSGLIGTLGNE